MRDYDSTKGISYLTAGIKAVSNDCHSSCRTHSTFAFVQNNNVIFRQIYEVFLDFFKVDCSECIEQA